MAVLALGKNRNYKESNYREWTGVGIGTDRPERCDILPNKTCMRYQRICRWHIESSWALSGKFMESPTLLLILAHFLWYQSSLFIQNFWVFCVLEAFQYMDPFQWTLSHAWSVNIRILSRLLLIDSSPEMFLNSFYRWISNFKQNLMYTYSKCDSHTI